MKNITLAPFVLDQPAEHVNSALKSAVRAMDKARHCAVLCFKEIVDRELFKELGYSSVYQYAAVELEFSKTRTGNFLQLARKLEGLPRLKQEMETGTIGYTKALELLKVANGANENQWVETAKEKSRQELRQVVEKARSQALRKRKANPAQVELPVAAEVDAPPVALTHRVTFELAGEQLAMYEALVEKAHKLGGVPAGSARADMLMAAMAALVEEAAAAQQASSGSATVPARGGPAVQIHVHHCPECAKAAVQTSKGEVVLTPQELGRLSDDARIALPGQPNRHTIAPGTRRRVLARDQHRCQAPGCGSTRFLEVHHIVPRGQGGSNAEENLKTLCWACHRRVHDRTFHTWDQGANRDISGPGPAVT